MSLYAHYLWRFQRATTVSEIRRLCSMAELDYLELMGGHGSTYAAREDASDHEAQLERLLNEWSGWHSSEVAIREGCPERWVRRQRVMNGLDPDHGDENDRDPTRRKIVKMSKRGASQRTIAAEMQISQARVSQVLAA